MNDLNNIDEEWKKFIMTNDACDNDSDSDCDSYDNFETMNIKNMNVNSEKIVSANLHEELHCQNISENNIPKSSSIYISTKTKIAFLNQPIDLKEMFWIIPVLKYMEPKNGVIKKQIKFNSVTEEELLDIQNRLKNEKHYEEQIITSINNPTGRIKFKDIRKVTIGLSKKDIMSYRSKKKSAFYNCFVLILRMKVDNIFKEIHVKVFNTGKLEIPGIQNDAVFDKVLDLVIETLQPNLSEKLYYKENTCETVLINSNFNCGFYINRETLYDILRYNYNIQAIYDPCSYPGIQCKFYFNPDVDLQNGCQISQENKDLYQNVKQVSFMIFRTGSVLIVGKCDEYVLMLIYEFLKNIFKIEYTKICQKISNFDLNEINKLKIDKEKKKKIRKKNILITLS
jgi:hypothetical protein